MAAKITRSTQVLFFSFTLLSLVSSSLTDKDQLAELEYETAPSLGVLDKYVDLMNQMSELMNEASRHLPDDFPSPQRLLNDAINYVRETKSYIEKNKERLDENLEDPVELVGIQRKIVELLQKVKDEL